jgi:hypothetical protein
MNKPVTIAAPTAPALPLVLHLSFAGSRLLVKPNAAPNQAIRESDDAIQQYLTARLHKLPGDLGLTERHFICGFSQLAVGADTAFTRACQALAWPQRFLLPQQRDDFLAAVSKSGTADFSAAQRDVALGLFASEHVIQMQVVSEAIERADRFIDVNLALVDVADVVVCLMSRESSGKRGGTEELLKDAKDRKRLVLEIRVDVGPEGDLQFNETWHNRTLFALPGLPSELAGLKTSLSGKPSTEAYREPVKAFASQRAKHLRNLFKLSALVIIGTHVVATFCAVAALLLHGPDVLADWHAWLPWVLGLEFLLLLWGFGTHQYLHLTHGLRAWAMARLVVEIMRSTKALREVPIALAHFFSLPMPVALKPLLNTISTLHLQQIRKRVPEDAWKRVRDTYLVERFTAKESGQIGYYEVELKKAKLAQAMANYFFASASFFAIGATGIKLVLATTHWLPGSESLHHALEAYLGPAAVLLPIVAVAAVSLVASFDQEARAHTFAEMLDFLRAQEEHLQNASSERAFSKLALETETRLLGETVSWYSRRAFVGVN